MTTYDRFPTVTVKGYDDSAWQQGCEAIAKPALPKPNSKNAPYW